MFALGETLCLSLHVNLSRELSSITFHGRRAAVDDAAAAAATALG